LPNRFALSEERRLVVSIGKSALDQTAQMVEWMRGSKRLFDSFFKRHGTL
jgi:hypothetical protein